MNYVYRLEAHHGNQDVPSPFVEGAASCSAYWELTTHGHDGSLPTKLGMDIDKDRHLFGCLSIQKLHEWFDFSRVEGCWYNIYLACYEVAELDYVHDSQVVFDHNQPIRFIYRHQL